jgi:hypothetical protein
MNPEYGLKQTLFINRLIDQVKTHGGYGDVLIPSRTDTKLYHEVLLKYADKITYLHGRIVFGTDEYWEGIWASEVLNGRNNPLYQRKGCFTSGPFPVMVVSFTKASIESMVGPTYDTMRAPKAVYKG